MGGDQQTGCLPGPLRDIVQRFGGTQFGIVDPIEPGGQDRPAQRCQRAALVIAGQYRADRHPHRAVEFARADTVGRRQIAVAAAHGHAVGFAHGRHPDHAIGLRQREIEIARHAADDRQLLPVLFAEQRGIGADLVEQFRDHRCHAVEMPGAVRPAQHLVEPLDRDRRGKSGRVHFRNCRRPQQIDAGVLQQLAVLRQLARIGIQILVFAELQRIDENRHRDAIGNLARVAHQRQMPVVQRAHRRHQCEGFSPTFERDQCIRQRCAGRDSLHGARLSFIVQPR